eukprot:TRINITY_DN61312_c0_g1_i1.p2 TRINITY_DN61312_c0_g1~~TRINITY_DN61312_c0_g1_i1.p2  ORF type:complete len:398 (+),score=111.90 TRINITY_DN61312_c0_g1_i1:107-1300(+)
MCWSLEVAALWAAGETVLLLGLLFGPRVLMTCIGRSNEGGARDFTPAMVRDWTRSNLLILPMCATICVVEWSEVMVWSTDPVREADFNCGETCPKLNQWGTLLAGWAVSLQPTFTMLYCRFTGAADERPRFTIPLVLAMLTTAGWWLRCLLGERNGAPASDTITALTYPCTCSMVGPKGHLIWRFALSEHEILPRMFAYHLFFNFALMFHQPPVGLTIGGGSVITLLIEFLVLGTNEAWSMWCWSGTLFIIAYMIWNPIQAMSLHRSGDATCIPGVPALEPGEQVEVVGLGLRGVVAGGPRFDIQGLTAAVCVAAAPGADVAGLARFPTARLRRTPPPVVAEVVREPVGAEEIEVPAEPPNLVVREPVGPEEMQTPAEPPNLVPKPGERRASPAGSP